MSSQSSGSKRKRTVHSALGDLLHPGEWGGKRAKSGSPLASGASTPDTRNSHSAAQSTPSSRSLSPLMVSGPLLLSQHPTTASNTPQAATAPNLTHQNSRAGAGGSSSTGASTGGEWKGLEQALRALHISTKIYPPLCSAVDDLVSCLPMFEIMYYAAARNRIDYDELATGLKSMVDLIVRHLNITASEETLNAMRGTANAIRKEIELIGMRQSDSLPRRILGASSNEDDLLRRYRQIEQLFRQLQGEASMDTWNTVNALMIDKRLEGLHPAKLARFDSELATETSRRACTKDTRTKILEDSMAWSDNPDLAKIYWMNGMAGTGKTTIAYSFCEQLEGGKQLAASFFCIRASPECRDAKRIIPTIAYQLARNLAPFRHALDQIIKYDPDIGRSQLSKQFTLLLEEPLLRSKESLPNNLVIVVDALDECSDPHIVELFLALLLRSAVELPVKFFITSRPEPAIWNKIMPEGEHLRSVLYLHEIEKSLVQADIELYLREELAFMSPADTDITKLAERAGKLFIYAATVARYIRPSGKSVNSQARLGAILAASTDLNKLSAIDELYTAVLVAAIDDKDLEGQERDCIQLVLWTVICACEPVLVSTLSALCGLDNENTTVTALQPLRSVLHLSAHTGIVTTLHASFPDFMFDPNRSGTFFCDKSHQSQHLAEQCFRIMQAQLWFNICSIQTSFIPDDEIPGLKERVRDNISEELFYACRFWADHLTHTNILTFQAKPSIAAYEFLSQRLLFWMEVLNLKKCVALCPAIMNKLDVWLMQKGQSVSPDLLKLTSDALKFVSNYAAFPTSAYTPHIYLSALPFSPPYSSVRSYYLPRFRGLVVVSGSAMKILEDGILATWELPFQTRSVSFSPDGGCIVYGGEGGELCIQSAYDGRYILESVKAHKGPIRTVGFSRDGMRVVSGSNDRALSVWSVLDGSRISGPFQDHEDTVTSVEFSPDGAHIVSGSVDCTVGIAVAFGLAVSMRRLFGHTRAVTSVSFSPHGGQVISGSLDETVRVWDVASGATVCIVQLPHLTLWYSSVSVRQLLSGFYFIAARGQATLYTWLASGASLQSGTSNDSDQRLTSMAISPTGDCIASGTVSGETCIWTRDGGGLVKTGAFKDRYHPICAINFSDDGSRLIAASSSRLIRICKVRGERETGFSPQCISSEYVACSHDMVHIAIYDCARGIQVLNMQESRLVATIECETTDINFLQYSLDGTSIFSVHVHGTIYKWDAHTGQLLECLHLFPARNDMKSIVYSCDGTRVVMVHGSTAELWDAQSNRCIATCHLFDHHEYQVLRCDIIFSRGSKRFLSHTVHNSSARRGVITVWDSDSGTRVAGPINASRRTQVLDFSSDGIFAALRERRRNDGPPLIGLFNVNTRKVLLMPLDKVPRCDMDDLSMKISPNVDYVACAATSTCYIWNIRDQTVVTALDSIGIIRAFEISLDGWCLAAFEDSATIRSIRFHVDDPPKPLNFTLRKDGWVTDSQTRVLFWVPKDIRTGFPRNSETHVAYDGTTLRIDYSKMVVGDRWSECYAGG